jgi:hypothetical protein
MRNKTNWDFNTAYILVAGFCLIFVGKEVVVNRYDIGGGRVSISSWIGSLGL